jgi:PBSX family phage terminase large subunit
MAFSNKQKDFLTTSAYDLNICSGSVRSGKTYITNLRFIDFLLNDAIRNVSCLITAKKGDSAERNVVLPMLELAEKMGILTDFRFTHNPRVLIYLPKNIRCYIEGGNDAGAEPRIRGITIQGWLADEVTTYPKDFTMQCVARCSAGKRLKFITTNPDSPSHWFKTDFIDKVESGELNGKVWYWDLDKDNPVLDRDYIKQLKSLYTGVFYERFICGRWVLAEGVVYDRFRRDEHIVDSYPIKQTKEYILGIDWGYAKDHPLAIVLMAVTDSAYYVIDEIYTEKQLIDKSLRELMEKKGWYDLLYDDYDPNTYFSPARKTTKLISYAYADSARPDLINQFYNISGITTMLARKDVNDGIQAVQRLLVGSQGYKIYFLKKCVNTIKEMELYRWDTKLSTGEGKDTPVKKDDHCPDAIRYAVFTRSGMARKVNDFRRG